jgi:uridine kinase
LACEEEKPMPCIIAVAAPIGGGKTAVARAIAARLPGAAALSFDHYEQATGQPVQNLQGWLLRGANFDEFVVSALREDLARLKRGEAVRDPATRERIPAARYLVFENPLGRAAASLAKDIDLLIWVDVPLDVALARKLRELLGNIRREAGPERLAERLAWLDRYLENYLGVVREVLLRQRDRIRPSADLILDGQIDPESLAERAAAEILRRFP